MKGYLIALVFLLLVSIVYIYNSILQFAISKYIGLELYEEYIVKRTKHEVRFEPTRKEHIPDRFWKNDLSYSPHNYEFTITAPSCGDNHFLVVMVASAMWEFERREVIRRTWASNQIVLEKSIRVLFFVADDHNSVHFNSLKQEATIYNDVIMENFDEKYRNLTLKTQGQLKWATEHCSSADYVMHVDDDVFVDLHSVVKYLTKNQQSRLMACSKVFTPVVRREGKWEMAVEDFPENRYPTSCLGWCFVLSQGVAKELYQASLSTHLIHLEDVTFTGILRVKIGNLEAEKIPANERNEDVCKHLGWPKDRDTNIKLIEAWRNYTNIN